MSDPLPNPKQLAADISRYCDGLLQPEEIARLEQSLTEDSHNLSQFLLQMEIQSALAWRMRSARLFEDGISREFQSAAAPNQDGDAPRDDALSDEDAQRLIELLQVSHENPKVSPGNPSSIPIPVPPLWNPAARQGGTAKRDLFSWPALSLSSVAAITAIAFLVTATGIWWFVSRSSNDPPPLANSRAAAGTSTDSVPQLPVITSLYSKAKTTTLRLEGIGFVTIEGPTDFCLIGPKRARLNYGRIKVRVTETTGHGFVIETPDGEVTDLGTEFALNVSQGSDSSLIVHEGKVDLRVGSARQLNGPERLVGGEAVSFNATGDMRRLMSVVASDSDATEEQVEQNGASNSPLITSVSDNRPSRDTKGYYQIVPKGLRDDALANVDQKHEWNGVDANGIPAYLKGADFVKTYNTRKKLRKTNVSVSLSRPAKLYIFWCDEREPPHEWLLREFQPTGDFIGLDAIDDPRLVRKARPRGVGPGESIDLVFSIWVREITTPGTVVLGTGVDPSKSGTYGIAAVELSDPDVSITP
jgi:hypothetical protein